MTRRRVALFILLTFLWYVATLATIVIGFPISMRSFGDGSPTPLAGRVLMTLHQILASPTTLVFWVSPRLAMHFSGLAGHALLLFNSALWGLLLTFGLTRLARRKPANEKEKKS